MDADTSWIVARYERGDTLREIAADLGVSHEAVRQQLLYAGVDMRSRGRQTPELDIDDLVRRYQAGESVGVLAAVTGVAIRTLRQQLEDAGAAIRGLRIWAG